MTDNSFQTRKPYETAPYASLRPAAGTGPKAAEPSAEAPPNDIAAEGDKLRALREALWAAFEAGPAAGLPNTLIDLTMAYTSALRLQLNLRALSARSPSMKPKSTASPRPVPTAKEA